MRVKRYVVDEVPEALPIIRSELGKDAVILNTKEIYVGGFLGLFRKKKMEVIAAVETNAPGVRNVPQNPLPVLAKPPGAAAAVAEAAPPPPLPQAAGMQRQQVARSAAAAVPADPEEVSPADQPSRDHAQAAPVRESAARSSARFTVDQDAVLEEIRQMKAMMAKLARSSELDAEPAALGKLRQRLAEQDVEQEWIELLVDKIKAHPGYNPETGEEAIWEIAAELLREWVNPGEPAGIRDGTRVVHVVGPTGVGKTTTIAKLAAEQVLRSKRKVGFITSDTYRIAAVDQLRTYANILNVPMEVVFSPLELARAFKQLEDRDIIFMDTAGRNFRNDLYVSEVNSLIQRDEDCDTFLVLSLTGKTRDLEAVASRFVAYGVTKVIYTKRDETDAIGSVLNLAMQHHLKAAYVTTGQNVPDDIEPFRSDRYVAQLLGAQGDD
ncbi:MAG: flagellar biosynthesis protein FlhF [Thermobacillus sp.]|uniref:flagellar biosynthesis protein FlhF n=1 Tax=Thermobacillus sp. TaxID=2108467 RepID=UPI000E3A60C4|nr:flagellar biosynthesis protein FlhF [Thermobacillus sp.]REK57917.1 MAG: flagellar biosynthesis protein FlhF [Thermobacillus sp.]